MTSAEPAASAPPPPPGAIALFGDRLELAATFADLLAGDGVAHGHLGPREVDRLWSRHLVNSALLTDLLPLGARFADVGSGAGLPGLPMAIRRPDLTAILVDPMRRRTDFLLSAVRILDLPTQVSVVRGRAEDADVRGTVAGVEWVVARAVAPLDRLMRWCLPLVAPGGRVLALKGASAADEVEQHRHAVARAGGSDVQIVELGAPAGANDGPGDTAWVVSVRRQKKAAKPARGRR